MPGDCPRWLVGRKRILVEIPESLPPNGGCNHIAGNNF